MTTLSLERIIPIARKSKGGTASAGRLRHFVASHRELVRLSMETAAAYEQAHTPVAQRAALDRFLAGIRN